MGSKVHGPTSGFVFFEIRSSYSDRPYFLLSFFLNESWLDMKA